MCAATDTGSCLCGGASRQGGWDCTWHSAASVSRQGDGDDGMLCVLGNICLGLLRCVCQWVCGEMFYFFFFFQIYPVKSSKFGTTKIYVLNQRHMKKSSIVMRIMFPYSPVSQKQIELNLNFEFKFAANIKIPTLTKLLPCGSTLSSLVLKAHRFHVCEL